MWPLAIPSSLPLKFKLFRVTFITFEAFSFALLLLGDKFGVPADSRAESSMSEPAELGKFWSIFVEFCIEFCIEFSIEFTDFTKFPNSIEFFTEFRFDSSLLLPISWVPPNLLWSFKCPSSSFCSESGWKRLPVRCAWSLAWRMSEVFPTRASPIKLAGSQRSIKINVFFAYQQEERERVFVIEQEGVFGWLRKSCLLKITWKLSQGDGVARSVTCCVKLNEDWLKAVEWK